MLDAVIDMFLPFVVDREDAPFFLLLSAVLVRGVLWPLARDVRQTRRN